MTEAGFPPISSLVPHAGPMCLLDRVLAHSPACTRCSVDPAGSGLLANPDGSVPAWVALEYMAQCIAVHGGLAARARRESLRPGLLLGSRRLRFAARDFGPGAELHVSARHHAGESGLVAFDCEVGAAGGGDPLVWGRVNVYIVESWQELIGGGEGHG